MDELRGLRAAVVGLPLTRARAAGGTAGESSGLELVESSLRGGGWGVLLPSPAQYSTAPEAMRQPTLGFQLSS
jgi:hypothetical protein